MIMTTPEMVLLMTTLGGAAAWVYEKYSGRGAMRIAAEKSKTDISDAIIGQLTKERDYPINSKSELQKANLELISFNKDLLRRDDVSNRKIERLSRQLQGVKNQLQLICLQMGIEVPKHEEPDDIDLYP